MFLAPAWISFNCMHLPGVKSDSEWDRIFLFPPMMRKINIMCTYFYLYMPLLYVERIYVLSAAKTFYLFRVETEISHKKKYIYRFLASSGHQQISYLLFRENMIRRACGIVTTACTYSVLKMIVNENEFLYFPQLWGKSTSLCALII